MKMKQNPTSDFQQLHNVDTTSVPDVETTSKQGYITSKQLCTMLIQRCFNLLSMFVKATLNPIELVMIMDLQINE